MRPVQGRLGQLIRHRNKDNTPLATRLQTTKRTIVRRLLAARLGNALFLKVSFHTKMGNKFLPWHTRSLLRYAGRSLSALWSLSRLTYWLRTGAEVHIVVMYLALR